MERNFIAFCQHFKNVVRHLREDVVFYKFDSESETARKMVERYPPNKKQRRICDRLLVPHLLWSFFEGEIMKHEKNTLAYKLYPLEVDTIKLPDEFDFGDMELKDEEKMFITHHEALEKLRRNSFCVQATPSRLSELCMWAIVERTGLRGLEEGKWDSLLPRKICRRLSFYRRDFYQTNVHIPLCKQEKKEIVRYFDIRGVIDLFQKKDEVFSKDFTDWFLNDDSICFEQFKDTHKLILIKFTVEEYGGAFGEISKCFECMRRYVRGCRIVKYFARTYEIRDVTFLKSIGKRCDYWCETCKRVPLFQIKSLQDFCDRYGAETKRIEPELFI